MDGHAIEWITREKLMCIYINWKITDLNYNDFFFSNFLHSWFWNRKKCENTLSKAIFTKKYKYFGKFENFIIIQKTSADYICTLSREP